MSELQSIAFLFNMIGFFLSLSSMTIVSHSSRSVVGKLRNGLLSLLWGLGIIALSFLWSIFAARIAFFSLLDLQPFLLALGMAFVLFATQRLFGLYRSIEQ